MVQQRLRATLLSRTMQLIETDRHILGVIAADLELDLVTLPILFAHVQTFLLEKRFLHDSVI